MENETNPPNTTFDVESYVETFSVVGLILLYIFLPPYKDGPEGILGQAVHDELALREVIWFWPDNEKAIFWDLDSEIREELRRVSRVSSMLEDFAILSSPIDQDD